MPEENAAENEKNPQVITKLVGEMCIFAQNSFEKCVDSHKTRWRNVYGSAESAGYARLNGVSPSCTILSDLSLDKYGTEKGFIG